MSLSRSIFTENERNIRARFSSSTLALWAWTNLRSPIKSWVRPVFREVIWQSSHFDSKNNYNYGNRKTGFKGFKKLLVFTLLRAITQHRIVFQQLIALSWLFSDVLKKKDHLLPNKLFLYRIYESLISENVKFDPVVNTSLS